MTLLLFGPTRRHTPCSWHGTHRVAPPGAGRFSTSFFGRAIWPRQGFGTKGVPWQLCPGGLNQTDVIQAFSRKTHVGNTRKCWQKIGNGPSQIKNKMMPHRSHKKGVLGFRWLEILKEFLEGRFNALFNIATSMPPKFNSPPLKNDDCKITGSYYPHHTATQGTHWSAFPLDSCPPVPIQGCPPQWLNDHTPPGTGCQDASDMSHLLYQLISNVLIKILSPHRWSGKSESLIHITRAIGIF